MHGIFGSEADAKLLAVAFSLPDFSQWQVLYRALSWSFQLTSCLFWYWEAWIRDTWMATERGKFWVSSFLLLSSKFKPSPSSYIISTSFGSAPC